VPVITAINGSQSLAPGETAVVQVRVQYASAASELG